MALLHPKFYLDAYPKCRLAVLERDTCPGGSWGLSKGFSDMGPV
jgi:hypothetical protein